MEPTTTKSMNPLTITLVILVSLFLVPISCYSSSCTETFYTISDSSDKNITQCVKLTTLRVEFGWNYSILKNKWTKIDVVVGRLQRSDVRWLAWGVNPLQRPQMVGTRAIIAIRHWNGSMEANTYYITNETKRGCHLEPSRIDVEVKKPTSHYLEENGIRYFALSATIILPPRYDISKLNHVWQVGYEFEGAQPGMHRTSLDNFDSWGTINLETREITGVGQHQRYLRKMHGILNIIGWGAVLPTGVIIARYFREHPFSSKSSWYYLHVTCQSMGYMLGTAGWALGMSLGHSSRLYRFRTHRLLAIFIFTFATLQMLALRLRPKVGDPNRKYWDIYHHFVGYALLAIIIMNIFHGIAILQPKNITWIKVYVGILAILGLIAALLEIYTWVKFLKQKRKKSMYSPAQSPKNSPRTRNEHETSTSSIESNRT